MAENVKVLKRDGSIEEFDPQKIARVTQAAGLEVDQAKDLSKKVDQWIKGLKQNLVSSLKIRNKVLAELKKVNQHAANLFEWYEKTKKG